MVHFRHSCTFEKHHALSGEKDRSTPPREFSRQAPPRTYLGELSAMQPPIQELHNFDPHLWVYDKAKMLAEIALPSNATGAPVTYMVGSKQYIAFPVGGGPIAEELIAVSL